MDKSLRKIDEILDKYDSIDITKNPKNSIEDTITRLRLIETSNNEVISGLGSSKVDKYRLDYFKSTNDVLQDAILHLTRYNEMIK